MAGDWIKVETATPTKPEVLQLARYLGVTRDDAFGKAMRFWLWLDGVSVDGRVDGVASHDVDAVVGVTGFCAALQRAGWVQCDDEKLCVSVPNFGRHNGVSAKARALKTRRQSEWRDRKTVDVSVDAAASTREEKRREEKKERKSAARFVPPTVDEVQTYSDQSALSLDASRFVDFYTSKDWKVGRNAMKDWRAAARNASRDGWCRAGGGANGEVAYDQYQQERQKRLSKTKALLDRCAKERSNG